MQKLFDIKKTQLEMAKDRGYMLSPQEEEILHMDLYTFDIYYKALIEHKKTNNRTVLNRLYDAKDENDKTIKRLLVYYGTKLEPQQKQISSNVIKEFIKIILETGVTEAVLIVDLNLSANSKEILSKLTSVKWQIFADDELIFNPVQHIDVPKHVLLTEEQKKAKLDELKTPITKLPIIKVNEPIIKYFNWPVGSVVKIERNDQSINILSPNSITYRVIIAN